MKGSGEVGVFKSQPGDARREVGRGLGVPVAAGDAQVVLEPGEISGGADGLAADGVPVRGGGGFDHGGELTAAVSSKTVPVRAVEIDGVVIYLSLASASTVAAFEGNRLAMLVAAGWAFDVLFALALRNFRRGRRA